MRLDKIENDVYESEISTVFTQKNIYKYGKTKREIYFKEREVTEYLSYLLARNCS